MRELIENDATTSEIAGPICVTTETEEIAESQNLETTQDIGELMRKLRKKRETLAEITKEVCETGQPRKLPARFVRNELSYARFGTENTKEIISQLYRYHGVICIFMDGNRQINKNPDGNPVEKIYGRYHCILSPLKDK